MPSSISVLSEINPLEDFTPKVGLAGRVAEESQDDENVLRL